MHVLALHCSDSPQLLSEIITVLRNDAAAYVRAHAALAIAALSGNRQQAIEPLIEALQDPDQDTRKAAAMALESMGQEAQTALPALRQALLEERCEFSKRLPRDRYVAQTALFREDNELNRLALSQVLLKALRVIERSE
jgi:oligoendopeptidase F